MELKHIDLAPISKLIGNNNHVLVNLLEDLVKGCENKYEDLNRNFKEKNWNSVKFSAHFLKSNFRHLGHASFTELLKKVEENILVDSKRDEVSKMIDVFNQGYNEVMDEVKHYLNYLKSKI